MTFGYSGNYTSTGTNGFQMGNSYYRRSFRDTLLKYNDMDDIIHFIRQANGIESYDSMNKDSFDVLGKSMPDEFIDDVKWCNFYLTMAGKLKEDENVPEKTIPMTIKFNGYSMPINFSNMLRQYYAYPELMEMIKSLSDSGKDLSLYSILAIPYTKVFEQFLEYMTTFVPNERMPLCDDAVECIRKVVFRYFNSPGHMAIIDTIHEHFHQSKGKILSDSMPMLFTVVHNLSINYEHECEFQSWYGREVPVQIPLPNNEC